MQSSAAGRTNRMSRLCLELSFATPPVGDAQPRWLRRPSYTSGWPVLIIRAVRVRQCILKITIVIFELQLVHLQPDSGRMDRVYVGRESTVRLVDVCADVPRALDDIRRIIAGLFQI